MLQDRKLVASIEGDDGSKHRWQVFGLAQYAAPFVEPSILIPVEIIDARILFGMADCRTATGATGLCCILKRDR